MQTRGSTPQWRWLLLWAAAQAIGIPLAAGVALFGGYAVGGLVNSAMGLSGLAAEQNPVALVVFYLSGLTLFSAIVGLAQWVVLRSWLNISRRWIDATILGGALGTVIGVGAFFLYGMIFGNIWPTVLAISMATIAPVQWLVLRRVFPYAIWWVVTSAIGALLAGNWPIGLLVYTIVTGMGLAVHDYPQRSRRFN